MNSEYDFKQGAGEDTVYIRPVDLDELPEEVQEEARAAGADMQLFAVHAADGERLALVKDRNMAFMLARQNEMAPVSVH